ncbi:MAG: flagellar motor switch protein FliG [Treponema sp.]|jgi:flagellar motor switch protein FliG|nr:flagellar motor switch protein FliG [Treponema sp.]
MHRSAPAPDGNDSGHAAPPPESPGSGPWFIKTPQAEEPEQKESKYRRVAKFLILTGAEEAARILPHLEPEQIEAVSREIAGIRGITAEEGEEILAEFRTLLSASCRFAGSFSGGPDTARRILYAAFGPERGEELLNRVPQNESPFKFMEDLNAEQIGILLKHESPAASAMILSRLSPRLCAAVLAGIPVKDRAELLRRIARQGEISPEVLKQTAQILREKAQVFGQAGTLEINGIKALADILRQGDYSFGDRILKDLAGQDSSLGRDLRDKMLTLDDAAAVDDRTLQDKLRTMTNRDIALLLKGKGQEFTEKLLSNVSGERRYAIREEGEIMGPVSRRDADDAARNFLNWLWSAGPQVLQTTKDVGL